MWLIIFCYLLMASTFTLAKAAVFYMKPIYFIAFRMLIAGSLLLAYIKCFKKKHWRFASADIKPFFFIALFHIYLAYILEFWSLQYISSSKVALLYNLSPFITALLFYLLYKQGLSVKKWIALIGGFLGMLPILIAQTDNEYLLHEFGFLSLAELGVLVAIGAAAFGWIIMKELIVKREYNPIMVNGIGMLIGGAFAMITAPFFEQFDPFHWNAIPAGIIGQSILTFFGQVGGVITMSFLCMILLILISNIIAYNLYGSLLRIYSPTFLSFAGFLTPFFATFFGWLFLNESIEPTFFISLLSTIAFLYLFYQEELKNSLNS